MKTSKTHRPLLHPSTLAKLKRLIDQPSQSVLLLGDINSEKSSLALHIAEQVLKDKLTPDRLLNILSNEQGSIGIDKIQQVHGFAKHLYKKSSIQQVVIVHEATAMTMEAQNALLKILEEPPKHLMIILTASQTKLLLPTIKSRVLTLRVINPTWDQVKESFENYDQEKVEQTYLLADGSMRMIESLLQPQENVYSNSLELAKKLISSDYYTRLSLGKEFLDDRNSAKRITDSIVRVLRMLIRIRSKQGKFNKNLINRLSIALEVREGLETNSNLKLQYMKLMSNI